MTRLTVGFAAMLGAVACWVSPAAAQSSSQTAQVLIIIPERPDLAEAEARAEGRATGLPERPAIEAMPAPAAIPAVPLPPPPMPRALQRLTTMERSAGHTQVLHTQIEAL